MATVLTGAKIEADDAACEAVYAKSFNYAIDQAQAQHDGKNAKADVAGMKARKYQHLYKACEAVVGGEVKFWLQSLGLIGPDVEENPDEESTPDPDAQN